MTETTSPSTPSTAPAPSAQSSPSSQSSPPSPAPSAGARTVVVNIRLLLEAGLTLEDVGFFAGCLDGDVATAPPSPQGLRIAEERLAVLEARIAAQTEIRDRLRAALRHASRSRPAA